MEVVMGFHGESAERMTERFLRGISWGHHSSP